MTRGFAPDRQDELRAALMGGVPDGLRDGWETH